MDTAFASGAEEARARGGGVDYAALVGFIQAQFTDGLALVIGSGLSAAEGLPGMAALAAHLTRSAAALTGDEATQWGEIAAALAAGAGLEAALLRHPPTERLEAWIVRQTCELLVPAEKEALARALQGHGVLRLTKLLRRVLRPAAGLPIVTTNYDRLVEVAKTQPIHIDLEHLTVTTPFQDRFTFDIDPFRKNCLLNGLDDVGLTLAQSDAIGVFEDQVRVERPFLATGVA